MLSDRNTVAMVAKFWGCSADTVYRRIADGTLPCLKMHGMIRITREQVAEYEARCTSSGNTPTASTTSFMGRGSSDAFQRGREIAGRLKNTSPNSSPVVGAH